MTRKKPFSNKKKKMQLQQKRKDKQEHLDLDSFGIKTKSQKIRENVQKKKNTDLLDDQKSRLEFLTNCNDATKLKSLFRKETREAIQERIEKSRQPFEKRGLPAVLERFKSIPMPERPYWTPNMTKEQIDSSENEYFLEYCKNLYTTYGTDRLNFFEHNLEVWRQLWRVLELSDCLIVCADIRHPLFHFPASLYNLITQKLKKQMIFVLNKCDLIPLKEQHAWMKYFTKHFPDMSVCTFTSYKVENEEKIQKQGNRKKEDLALVAELWNTIKQLNLKYSKPEIWETLQKSALSRNQDSVHMKKEDRIQPAEKEIITLGLIGHPNVGKSTILNALIGKHVVSSSYTPGHTKHFQTYFVHPNVRLCDSPGLVFPAIDMPLALQILCGIFPIAQVREPYSAVGYLAERLPLEDILKLELPEDEENWSPWNLCVAYAEKKRFFNNKGRTDEYRAANKLLREALRGEILLAFKPPDNALWNESSKEVSSNDYPFCLTHDCYTQCHKVIKASQNFGKEYFICPKKNCFFIWKSEWNAFLLTQKRYYTHEGRQYERREEPKEEPIETDDNVEDEVESETPTDDSPQCTNPFDMLN